jgi:hypothetical protein
MKPCSYTRYTFPGLLDSSSECLHIKQYKGNVYARGTTGQLAKRFKAYVARDQIKEIQSLARATQERNR